MPSSPLPSDGNPSPQFAAVMPIPFGHVGIATRAGFIEQIVFLPNEHPLQSARDELAEKAVAQIERYLQDPDAQFALPLLIQGSLYRRRIWTAIAAIPCGRTRTYGELAKEVGSVPRAVGQACGDNPFPLAIPCHRVVTHSGIGGFAHNEKGYLIDIKRWLLAHEGNSGHGDEIQGNLFETPRDISGQPDL